MKKLRGVSPPVRSRWAGPRTRSVRYNRSTHRAELTREAQPNARFLNSELPLSMCFLFSCEFEFGINLVFCSVKFELVRNFFVKDSFVVNFLD